MTREATIVLMSLSVIGRFEPTPPTTALKMAARAMPIRRIGRRPVRSTSKTQIIENTIPIAVIMVEYVNDSAPSPTELKKLKVSKYRVACTYVGP
jgi:hypothetical protein